MNKILLLVLLPFTLLGQKHDNIWLFGYESDLTVSGIDGVIADFANSENLFSHNLIAFSLRNSSAAISDNIGNLLFYTNGCTVANADHEIMLNGDNINPGEVHDIQCDVFGYTSGSQSSLILPMPSNDSLYYLFHKGIEYIYNPNFNVITTVLYKTIVNVDANNGIGRVEEKNIPIIIDSLSAGQLTAVKHANGKDWYLIVPQYLSNKYYILKLTEQGVELFSEQEIGNATVSAGEGGGQAVFSPNGQKYIRYTPPDGIFIFDFDREEGLLSNFQHIEINDGAFAGGAVISPNSRVLYIPSELYLYQFDLEAADIAASKILIDTFDGYTSPFSTTFFNGQLAPDCKIYINSFATVDVLHVIHNPDELGTACNFEQHAVQLPFNHLRSLPHFPNYRLGALVEGEEPLPPCELIVSTEEIPDEEVNTVLTLFPNPVSNELNVQFHLAEMEDLDIQIIDGFGKVLRQVSMNDVYQTTIPTAELAQGVYYCQIKKGKEIIATERFVIIR